MSSSQLNEYKICTYGEMKRLRFVHFLFFSSVALLLTTNIFIKYFYKTHAHALSMPVYGRWQHDYQTISSMIDAYHHNWNPQMSAESRQAKTKHMALFNFKTDAVYECISPPPLSLSLVLPRSSFLSSTLQLNKIFFNTTSINNVKVQNKCIHFRFKP